MTFGQVSFSDLCLVHPEDSARVLYLIARNKSNLVIKNNVIVGVRIRAPTKISFDRIDDRNAVVSVISSTSEEQHELAHRVLSELAMKNGTVVDNQQRYYIRSDDETGKVLYDNGMATHDACFLERHWLDIFPS